MSESLTPPNLKPLTNCVMQQLLRQCLRPRAASWKSQMQASQKRVKHFVRLCSPRSKLSHWILYFEMISSEELGMPMVGKVVSKESATFPGYNPRSIHANHSDMVRFATPDDNRFKRVVGELVRWESELRYSSTPRKWPSQALNVAKWLAKELVKPP